MTVWSKEVWITLYLCPYFPSAFLPICFPYNHSPLPLHILSGCCSLVTHQNPQPLLFSCLSASRLPFAPSLFVIPSSNILSGQKQHIQEHFYTGASLQPRALCVRTSWLATRKGRARAIKLLFQCAWKPAKGHNIWKHLADLPKCIETRQMFPKSVILIHWCFRALYARRPFTPWQTDTWVWCRDNEPEPKPRSSAKPEWSKFSINQGR